MSATPDKWTHTPAPGFEERDRLHPSKDDWEQLEKYRDRYIGKHADGTITVRQQGDPSYGEFIVALDDSKTGGNRRDIPEANNIETARKYIDWSLDGPENKKDKEPRAAEEKGQDPNRPLTEKQAAVIEKYGTPELKESLKKGEYEICRKKLDEMMKALKSDYEAKPLTEKQQAVIDRHGDDKLKEAVRTGNYGIARDFIASLHTKLEKDYNTKPLTEKQAAVIDKYAPEEIRKAVSDGNLGEGRKFIAELHQKIEREYNDKPLTEKQIGIVARYADEKTTEEIRNGAYGKGRDLLDNLYREVNAEVSKYEKAKGELSPEDKVNLQKAELFIKQGKYQHYRESIYNETMEKGISTDGLKKLVEKLEQSKTHDTIPKQKGMDR
ncbi:MAG TPA: hypothetical protein P5077_08825 [bacterium]|nr:hypothetical protein [bacterium]